MRAPRVVDKVLLSRAEMTHEFRGARFDLARDRQLLGWVFNQFLYGEVTGIQCGHWLYNAPSLDAARFLAKQASEELQHVDNFLRILTILDVEPGPPHRVVRFLSTGMMPSSWAEHVSLEMAFGEGLVLACFYALIDTLPDGEISTILTRATKQEEGHVHFGETEAMREMKQSARLRRRLLGLNLVSLSMVRRFARHIGRTMDMSHPVIGQVGPFLQTVVRASELRLERMGYSDRPIAELSAARRAALVAEAYAGGAVSAVLGFPRRLLPFTGPRRLTETYLRDPAVTDFSARTREKARAAPPRPLAREPQCDGLDSVERSKAT